MQTSLQLFLTFITSLIICSMSLPAIINISKLKHLYDEPDNRKKHKSAIPTLGGVAIFGGFVFSTTFWATQKDIIELQYIIASIILIFFIGIKDDIIHIHAWKKLIVQILAAGILIFCADIRLTSLYGLFDVQDISYLPSALLTMLAIIGITNSFNLIDGIDTLAASIGMLTTILFGSWFHYTGHIQYAIVSFSLLGALIPFYWYNKTPAKIFMGDTGSLLLGMVGSILAIKFIEFNKLLTGDDTSKIYAAPAIAISVLLIPITDTIRVFTIRILQGKSPFSPDRNHIHHLLTDLGLSHIKSTLILLSLNILVISFNLTFQRLSGELLLILNITFVLAFSSILARKRRQLSRDNQIHLIKTSKAN